MCRGANFSHALELLAAFKKGECSGARVRLGRLQQLLSTSCCEHLDFLVERDPDLADRYPTVSIDLRYVDSAFQFETRRFDSASAANEKS